MKTGRAHRVCGQAGCTALSAQLCCGLLLHCSVCCTGIELLRAMLCSYMHNGVPRLSVHQRCMRGLAMVRARTCAELLAVAAWRGSAGSASGRPRACVVAANEPQRMGPCCCYTGQVLQADGCVQLRKGHLGELRGPSSCWLMQYGLCRCVRVCQE